MRWLPLQAATRRSADRPEQLRFRRWLATLGGALALLFALLFVAPSPASAQSEQSDQSEPDTTEDVTDEDVGDDIEGLDETGGLLVSSLTEYVPDTDNELIEVTATFNLTNEQPDEIVGTSVRSFFYTTWVIALPSNVTDFAAFSSGAPLVTQIDSSTAGTDDPNEPDPNANILFGSITLPFNLNFGQSVTIEATYTIPGGEPRADTPVARVNDSFLSFPIWAAGDPGLTDIRIAIPEGFTTAQQGDLPGLEEVTRDGQRVLEAIGIENPRMFFGQIYGRNDRGLITEQADLPDGQATIRAWPDDPEWAEFVVQSIERDIPIIEDLTGLAWPAGDIEVIETITPYLYGYGGWFNASSGLIEIGETLERDLILHELAHAWFNADFVEGRWITEGLAEEFASQTIAATTSVVETPPTEDQLDPRVPDLDAPIRVPLDAWSSPWSLNEEDAFTYEQFHYNASWFVIRQITDDVGLDAFSDVLVALRNDELPYPGEGPIEQTQTPTRWTHFFDLLEMRAGATGLDGLFSTYVLRPSDAVVLVERREALDAYEDLTAEAEEWAAPLVIRHQLAEWKFDTVAELIEDARQVIDLRDQADALATELDITVDYQAEVAFETATSSAELGETETSVQEVLEALETLAAARSVAQQRSADLNTPLTFAPLTLEEAQRDVQDKTLALESIAELRAQVEQRASELGTTAPSWRGASEAATADLRSAVALAEARLVTLAALESASFAVNDQRSITERVGMWGSDPDAEYAIAIAFFEADELDDALDAAGRTEALLMAASTTGTRRLQWSGAIVGVAVLMTVFIARRRT